MAAHMVQRRAQSVTTNRIVCSCGWTGSIEARNGNDLDTEAQLAEMSNHIRDPDDLAQATPTVDRGKQALQLLVEIHEKLGYLPTWTRTAGEITEWYRRATAFLGDDAILDPVKKRILGKV